MLVGGGTGVAIATGAGTRTGPHGLDAGPGPRGRAGVHRRRNRHGDRGWRRRAAYGVEVRLNDGRVVEVRLDANFQVLGHEADDDGSEDQDGSSDD